ncbi:hypothetical protein GOBAR_AA37698 [Gossypium barbadense]|uniref:Uncharacterized protein n=1 Tax=Gossypium barbadense TaxID=3634 RepID=A0A2P5VW28_GOSBA|nr:hypothetical protein GOBAR_AA37698 [Gossypium barbadense]
MDQAWRCSSFNAVARGTTGEKLVLNLSLILGSTLGSELIGSSSRLRITKHWRRIWLSATMIVSEGGGHDGGVGNGRGGGSAWWT